jgi:pyruvate/2-oxoglutarate dehydrogenase complex dihydrolipoamide dehydrogenase (E3) component
VAAGIAFDVLRDDFVEDDRAIIDQYPESLVKLFVLKGKVMGGTIIAPLASELVQELILAQNIGISIEKLFTKTYPYPTATRINERVIGKYLSRKLTEKSKRLLFH